MLPISVSDMLKLLDKLPVWKSLVTLPKRVEEMERRVAMLEKSPAPPALQPAEQCPACGGKLAFLEERRHPVMGAVGMKLRKLRCPACALDFERDWSADGGYS